MIQISYKNTAGLAGTNACGEQVFTRRSKNLLTLVKESVKAAVESGIKKTTGQYLKIFHRL